MEMEKANFGKGKRTTARLLESDNEVADNGGLTKLTLVGGTLIRPKRLSW